MEAADKVGFVKALRALEITAEGLVWLEDVGGLAAALVVDIVLLTLRRLRVLPPSMSFANRFAVAVNGGGAPLLLLLLLPNADRGRLSVDCLSIMIVVSLE